MKKAWLTGAALIALTLTASGCFEGSDNFTYGYGTSERGTAPAVSSYKPGYEILNEYGVRALTFPLGISRDVVATNDTNKIYSDHVTANTVDELAKALVLEDGAPPRQIMIPTPLVLTQRLKVRGNVELIGPHTSALRILNGGGFDILPYDDRAHEHMLETCSLTRWESLIDATSLRLDILVDGALPFDGESSFHLVIGSQPDPLAKFIFNLSHPENVLIATTTSIESISLSMPSGPAHVAASEFTSVKYERAPATPDYKNQLTIDSNSTRQNSSWISSYPCQNLAADVYYPAQTFEDISGFCSSGGWDALTTTFASCGGAL